jgi:hypothetical protein
MDTKLGELKRSYYAKLDGRARRIARIMSKGGPVGLRLLRSVEGLYLSALYTQKSFDQVDFKEHYHPPISSELEFLVARILHHYSYLKELHWSVHVRCQKGKTAPDIRIEHCGKTLAIVEIKARAGWIQPFFSSERAGKDMAKLREGKSTFNPEDLIRRVNNQFRKYCVTYSITPKQVFVLLPTLALVHRKRSKRVLKDYENDFARNSGLPRNNLILLSNNLRLDLSQIGRGKEYAPTKRFEGLVQSLVERTTNQ